MAHTPQNCPIVDRRIKDLEASYNKMLTDDRVGGDCHKTGKFHESIIHAATVSGSLSCLLLGTVLRFYQILLAKIK